jgi:DNA polymerase-3 subunit gamma/tau
MSYIALARKWRPRTFNEIIGQEHVNLALINSLRLQRIHHAYLFTGTRGVGKTSIARLFAKALNCEQGITDTPCLQCDTCISIEQGRFIDLIEIDGASRTRVEDTRELLDNVQYVPSSGRFKIYLIDEVHMLSTHSFNALLKTLEEPPSHVKFLLATTESQKLPATILSRCLQFNLRHVPEETIALHLNTILTAEKLSFEADATSLLAKAAKGSIRDALSLLDQAIACSGEKLKTASIKDILGFTQQDYAIDILLSLAKCLPEQLLDISKLIATEGSHFSYVVDELLSHLHQLSIHQAVPSQTPMPPALQNFTSTFSPEDIQLFYQIVLNGGQELHLAPTPLIGFQMLLLRMYTFRPAPIAASPALLYENMPEESTNTNNAIIAHTPSTHIDQSVSDTLLATTGPISHGQSVTNWAAMLPALKLSGLALNAAENAEFISKTNNEVLLRVSKGHQSVFTTTVMKRIEQGLTNYYQEVIKLTICSAQEEPSTPAKLKTEADIKMKQSAAEKLRDDPFFQQLQQEFSAELVTDSVASLRDEL